MKKMNSRESDFDCGSDWWPLPSDRLTRLDDVKSRLSQRQNVAHSSQQKFYKSLFTEWTRDSFNEYRSEASTMILDDSVSQGLPGSACLTPSFKFATGETRRDCRYQARPQRAHITYSLFIMGVLVHRS